MKTAVYTAILMIFFKLLINAADFTEPDKLYISGNYTEGLKIILSQFDSKNPEPSVIWRISRFYLEIGDEMNAKNKKEKIEAFSNGMKIAEPYLDTVKGEKLDRALMVFWYTANFGLKNKTTGIVESISNLQKLFDLADKAVSIDPTLAASYLLKGQIDEEVPAFLGGDSFRMGINFSLAIKYNPYDMNVLVDAADAFLKRNWDFSKKKSENAKHNTTDGTPPDISDREYAKQLLKKSFDLYASMKTPSKRDKTKFIEAQSLYNKNFQSE